jgi:tetratricopeptide (TPR) repeat protein
MNIVKNAAARQTITAKCVLLVMLLVMVLSTGWTATAFGKSLAPPADPAQSITYWKPHTISPRHDALVEKAQAIFSVLLRAWDSSRLEPSLYVVESAAGPWAASLADGNILLSRAAIEACVNFGEHRAEHLLAFVLAHELAHQRADDLWHQRFFRLVGNQSPESAQKMLRGLQMDDKLVANIEQKEAQADHDGLIMMASVGYDPYQILDKNDFFTQWVENIWQNSCLVTQASTAEAEACKQAQSRALRAQAQLSNVATQSLLYELGVQAFVAGNYYDANRYFTAYGRDYPSRAVLTALGLTQMAKALQIHQELIHTGALQKPDFYYPLLLDATAAATPSNHSKNTTKRASQDAMTQQQLDKIRQILDKANDYFEKAIRLEPNHRKSYLLLAMSYLMADNTFMARGVLQGKYIPRFQQDAASELLLAMTSALEKKSSRAQREFEKTLKQLAHEKPPHKQSQQGNSLPDDLLIYTAYHNYAALLTHTGSPDKAQDLWKNLATAAKQQTNPFLFRLALNHLNPESAPSQPRAKALQVAGKRLGDTFLNGTETSPAQASKTESELWIEGDLYHVYRFDDGSRFVVGKDQRILSAWQASGRQRLTKGLALGDSADRSLKTFGVPNRRMHMLSGEYLAYDDYGIAIHIDNHKIAGWFLY